MTPAPADWATDMALDLIAIARRDQFVLAQERIAERLRNLQPTKIAAHPFSTVSDDDHD